MKILQLCYEKTPKSNSRNGGELKYWQDLASLVKLGHEVILVIYAPDQLPNKKAHTLSSEVLLVERQEFKEKTPAQHYYLHKKRKRIIKSIEQVFNPLHSFHPIPQSGKLAIKRIVDDVNPDLIWAETLPALMLLPKGLFYPIVYAHQDFRYKLIQHRRTTLQNRTANPLEYLGYKRLKQQELSLIKRSTTVACASYAESVELERSGMQTVYIPVVGKTFPRPRVEASSTGRFFLFGKSKGTAMSVARKHLIEQLWDEIQKRVPDIEWHQVGEPLEPSHDDWNWIQKNFVTHGYVDDLSQFFRLGDATFMPYRENTGFRVKFTTSTAYGLVNIGYKETFLCSPEFQDQVNCLMADSPHHLVDLIFRFANNKDLRIKLGKASRELYEQRFTFEAQLPKYDKVLSFSKM